MGKIEVITSGKGGVGKSTASVILGYYLKKAGKKVIILELDVGLRSLDIMLGAENETSYDLSDILSGECEPYKAIRTSEAFGGLQFISAPGTVDFEVNGERFTALCMALRRNYDYVIVDSPAGIGELFKISCSVADEALIVTTPDMVCMRDAGNVSDILLDMGVKNQRLIINKLCRASFKKSAVADLDEVIDTAGVRLIGVIEQDDELMHFVSSGKMPKVDSDVLREFENTAQRIDGKEVPVYVIKY